MPLRVKFVFPIERTCVTNQDRIQAVLLMLAVFATYLARAVVIRLVDGLGMTTSCFGWHNVEAEK